MDGKSSPSVLAIFRLITKSYLVGACLEGRPVSLPRRDELESSLLGKPAAVQVGALGNVAPVHDQSAELGLGHWRRLGVGHESAYPHIPDSWARDSFDAMCIRGKRHARKVRVGGDKTPVWWNCRQPPRIRQLRNPTGRKEGATMRMPGFTAEGSLYTSKTQYKTNHRHPNGASHNVVPQLPIRIGRTCGECISGVHGVRFGGFGTQQCCDFYCDPAKGQCFTSNCATEYCWSLGNVFDRGGGGINAGGGINTGGGVFNTGGGVSQ